MSNIQLQQKSPCTAEQPKYPLHISSINSASQISKKTTQKTSIPNRKLIIILQHSWGHEWQHLAVDQLMNWVHSKTTEESLLSSPYCSFCVRLEALTVEQAAFSLEWRDSLKSTPAWAQKKQTVVDIKPVPFPWLRNMITFTGIGWGETARRQIAQSESTLWQQVWERTRDIWHWISDFLMLRKISQDSTM